jgi:hypothetical protein
MQKGFQYGPCRSNAKLIYPTPSLTGMGLTHVKPDWEGIPRIAFYLLFIS